MKVYIIFRGEYSDKYIVFITENKQVAEKYCELYSFEQYGAPYYETYDTNEKIIDDINNDIKKRMPYWEISYHEDNYGEWIIHNSFFDVCFDRDKNNTKIFKSFSHYGDGYTVEVYGYEKEDFEKVKKIARDMLMEQLAKDNNLV